RHDVPSVEEAADRLGVKPGAAVAHVMKTIHTAHGGKLSVSRILSGVVTDGAMLTGSSGHTERTSGLFKMFGPGLEKITEARV
ncbi:hypothetical protein ABTD84_20755, partial [Acinetobacter baumannii]